MSTEIIEQPKALIDLEQIKRKKVNLAIFGHGNVGSILIDQIIASGKGISKRRNLDLNIFAVANSSSLLLEEKGISGNWQEAKREKGTSYCVRDIISFAQSNNLENLIAIDNTANEEFVKHYKTLVEEGFSLVSSNKIGNTLGLDFYKELRELLSENNKEYLYETNVGAGLPLVDTIKLLHLSGENITRIKGVFSGSLSYIFNHFSEKDELFSTILKQAISKGYTEPDPREDLCGKDVARKLLILARELDLHTEFEDVKIQNLIPKALRTLPKETFLEHLKDFDVPFHIKRNNQLPDHVLRYVGDLHGDLSREDGAILEVKLVSVPKNSMLGQLKGSDSIFEIYTESYGNNPIVIQGAGAGATVTARGVFGDILRLSDKLN
ncbi:homoserine dehydrogenase [Ulvibacter sp. MAR_2010_11]|nr:homoserine dehydrogenase [Ulvibacter sp. MAR_2010_11]